MTDDHVDPLPQEWLPEPAGPPAGDTGAWEHRVQRVVAEAGPRLDRLASRRSAREPVWWQTLGGLWRPAAALAAAALLFLLLATPDASRSGASSPVLAAMATEGEPTSVWATMGGGADPVLAAMILEQEDAQ